MSKAHPRVSPAGRVSDKADDTPERLLRAAAEVFAQHGFDKANVRDICAAAGANVSAVKYHFGGKEELYREVWAMAAKQMIAAEPMPRLQDYADAREALSDFIAWFMRLVLLENDAQPVAGCLLAHETVEPTGALDLFVKFCAGPIRSELEQIVRAVVGGTSGKPGKPGKRALDDLTNAVIALCVNPKHSYQILSRLGFPPPTHRAGINRMAKTMAQFALSGLESFAQCEVS